MHIQDVQNSYYCDTVTQQIGEFQRLIHRTCKKSLQP